MVDKRVAERFTVYQTNLHGDSAAEITRFWESGMVGVVPAVGFYQDELDRRRMYTTDAGLVNALGFAWTNAVLDDGLGVQTRFARYLVARYGALPVLWTTGGEVAGYLAQHRDAFIDGWREVANLVDDVDDYGHPQTAHSTNERPYADY